MTEDRLIELIDLVGKMGVAGSPRMALGESA